MLNVRLAGCHLYGKQVFTRLSLVVALIASFCAVLFPIDVVDEIWDVIESVSERFLTYSYYAPTEAIKSISSLESATLLGSTRSGCLP